MANQLADHETLAALLMAYAPGMPYGNAEVIALAAVMDDAIPPRWAEVTANALNVRTYPATERDGAQVTIVHSLPLGERVRVWMVRADGWWCVTAQKADGKITGGWVAAEFLTEAT